MSRSHKNWFSNSVVPFILLQRERQRKSSFSYSVRFEPRGDAVRRARRSRHVVEKLLRHGASLGARAMRRGVKSRGVLVLVFVGVIMTGGSRKARVIGNLSSLSHLVAVSHLRPSTVHGSEHLCSSPMCQSPQFLTSCRRFALRHGNTVVNGQQTLPTELL